MFWRQRQHHEHRTSLWEPKRLSDNCFLMSDMENNRKHTHTHTQRCSDNAAPRNFMHLFCCENKERV